MRSTAGALTDFGLTVAEAFEAAPPLTGIDVVHGFGLTVAEVGACRQALVRVALSTIYWPRSYRYAYAGGSRGMPAALSRARRVGGAVRCAVRPKSEQVSRLVRDLSDEIALIAVYSAADVLSLNACGERSSIVEDLGVDTPSVVVPNAVDPDLFPQTDQESRARPVDVVMVGRIEPHKNQLGLINAMRGKGRCPAIIGADHPHHTMYADQSVSQGRGGLGRLRWPDSSRRARPVLRRRSSPRTSHMVRNHGAGVA